MTGSEGIGEALASGAHARPAGSEAGESAEIHTEATHPHACLNCGATLQGEYCHRCGQAAHVHRSFASIWHDLAHSVLHFEGKVWRTLPMLAWRPGELTRRYIEGERARFLSPVATFLFSVFLMFAVFNNLGRQAYYVESPADRLAPGQTPESAGPIDMDLSDAPGPLPRIDQAWRRAKANPSLLAYKLQTNAYKYSWALIPISAPLLWLLFLHRARYRRQYRAYDHTVFVTYALAFMSLFAIIYTLLKLAGMTGTIALLPFAVPPIHLYRQLRGAYRLSVWSALWRTMLLIVFGFVAGGLFFMLLLMSGLLG